MSALLSLVCTILLVRTIYQNIRNRKAARRNRLTIKRYTFDTNRNRALALAHPIAAIRAPYGFGDAAIRSLPQELASPLRGAMLHQLGLRSSMQDDKIRQTVTNKLKTSWYRIGLDQPFSPDDNPRDTIAFACARTAFVTRIATLLGWLDEETQWKILIENAERAQDCFDSWRDYGTAWANGRKQWILNSRADSLGGAFSEEEITHWLQDRNHPWSRLSWNDGKT